MSNQVQHPEIGQQDAAALAAGVAVAEKKAEPSKPAEPPAPKAEDPADKLREKLSQVEGKLAEAEIAKAKMEGEMKDQKAAESALAEAYTKAKEASEAFGQAKALLDEAEKKAAEAGKISADLVQLGNRLEKLEARLQVVAERKEPPAPPAPPVIAAAGDGGQCCCHPWSRTAIGAVVVVAILIALGAVGYYFATRSPQSVTQPAPKAPVPSIYRVVPDAQGNPTLKKVSGFFWSLVGGVAMAEDKAVAVPEPAVIIYDDKSRELAVTEAEVKKLEAEVKVLEAKLQKAEGNGAAVGALRSQLKTKREAFVRVQSRLATVLTERDEAKLATAKQESAVKITALQLGYGQLDGTATATDGVAKLLQKTTETKFSADGKPTSLTVTEPAGASGHSSKDRCGGTEIVMADGQGGAVYYCAPAPSKESLTIPAPSEPEALDSKYLKCLGWAAVGMAGGGAGNYGYARMADRNYDGRDVAIGVAGGGALGYGLCLFFTEEKK